MGTRPDVLRRRGGFYGADTAGSGADGVERPRLAHLPGHVPVRLAAPNDLPPLRAPPQLSTQPHRQHAQVTHARRAVADLRLADRRPPCADAVEEVGHVVVAGVEPL